MRSSPLASWRNIPTPTLTVIGRSIVAETALDAGANAFGNVLSDRHGRGGHHDDEFFSTETGTNIEDPNACAQQVRNFPQCAISLQMPTSIVDLLEVIDINQEQCEVLPLPPSALHLGIEPRLEVSTVEERSDRIDGGELGDFRESRP